ncbi:MAG: polyphenol oxidase family protein [Patescibacteria group bacterium]|nr:polyphenol oxidase family protein [Patescibacteria group bacterium]
MHKFKIFGREFGDVQENREKICEELGIPTDNLYYANQIHSDNILAVRERPEKNYLDGYDAFISNVPGLFFMVKVADCQGVLMYDDTAGVVTAVHSGWRGSVKNIVGKTVQKMISEFGCNPQNIHVVISPSLGPCCAEFTDPHAELPECFGKYIDGKKCDFWRCTEDQLTAEGVLPENVNNMRICTVCNTDKYFSYRKEGGENARNGAIIGLV